MLTDSEKRAIFLAVSRSAPDAIRARKAFQATLATLGKGSLRELLQALVRQKLLSAHQAHELGESFGSAHLANVLPRPASDNNEAAVADIEPPPRQLGGYRILRKLGQGGMCPVFLGYQEGHEQKVAIKILPEQLAGRQGTLDRFYREAKSGSLLNHPNIVRNLAFGQDRTTDRHFLVMEYVDGPSALDLLEQLHHLSVADAVHVILDIARGLEHAHSRNIIHRDVKPDNILITETGVAKLADMGLAKRTDENSHLTAARQGFGTPYYMPYEQAVNARQVDGRSDIYALGATLYHLVTGEVPFSGDSHVEVVEKKGVGLFPPASSLNPDVPPVLDDILELALARDPKDRYQTISEMIVALERADLAAPVPSFVDREMAHADPLLRDRLAAVEPTSLDLHLRVGDKSVAVKSNPDIWYLRFQTRDRKWCKTRATTGQILKRLRDGKIPRSVQAAHQINGTFHTLRHYAIFRRTIPGLRKNPALSGTSTVVSPDNAVLAGPTFWQAMAAEISNRWVLYAGGTLVAAILLMVGTVVWGLLKSP
jgi:serine/threonine-protein kinase